MDPKRARYQTRTEATVAKYLARADGLLTRMAQEMQLPDDAYPAPNDVVDYMRRHANEWRWATFRQYQASLVCRYELEYEKNQDPLFDATAKALRTLPHNKRVAEDTPARTSSHKRKGVLKRDYDRLVTKLENPKEGSDYSKRAALWLVAATATGLRPCEWQHAELVEDGTGLKVQNAKATNGRGTGPERVVPLNPEDLPIIAAHLTSIQEMQLKGKTFQQFHMRCSEALRRACASLWPNNLEKRYALYSARHQFAANHKATATHEEVAELLGHSSVRTARRHYAPRRSAWAEHRQQAKPVPASEPDSSPKQKQ